MACSIFALELAVRTQLGSPLRQRLHDLVASHPERSSPLLKSQLYQQIGQALYGSLNWAERGCWDYFDDHDRAVSDFEMWCNGMRTQEGVRHEPSIDPYVPTQEPRYLTFTVAVLLHKDTPSDLSLRARCQVPETNLWQRQTFAYLLQGLPSLDFSHVVADCVYLIPGNDTFSLTPGDLALEKFEYLRALV